MPRRVTALTVRPESASSDPSLLAPPSAGPSLWLPPTSQHCPVFACISSARPPPGSTAPQRQPCGGRCPVAHSPIQVGVACMTLRPSLSLSPIPSEPPLMSTLIGLTYPWMCGMRSTQSIGGLSSQSLLVASQAFGGGSSLATAAPQSCMCGVMAGSHRR